MLRRLAVLILGVLAGIPAGATEAAAVPAFARQTGASCTACHFQHFPSLTPYGRVFKRNGYLQSSQGLIESEFLSLPAALSASLVTKIRYVKTNGASEGGTDVGELQFPDEAALFLGGRVGTFAGFLLEAQLADPDAPMFAAFKMPLGGNVAGGRLSFIPFSTDALGTPFGFELLNTGAVRNVRAFEDRAVISAQQYVVGGADEGRAEGVAVVFARDEGFVSVTPWTPAHGTVEMDRAAWYVRSALIRRIGSWDMAVGGQYWFGAAPSPIDRADAWAVDAQAQIERGVYRLGVYLTYARAGTTPFPESGTGRNIFNANPFPQWAVAGALELGLHSQVTLGAGYRRAETGAAVPRDDDNAGLLGATVQVAQNVQIQLNQVFYSGSLWEDRRDARKTIVMLFAAF